MLKKHMTPLTKGGSTTVHAGKGSNQQPLGVHNNVNVSGSAAPSAGINNYAKATPMAQPSPDPSGDAMGQFPPLPGG